MVTKANASSVPRAQRILGKANCLASDAVGACVRITGPKVSGLYQVALCDITIPAGEPSVGIIVRKYSPTLCVVQFHGPTAAGVFSGLVPNQAYMVGTNGLIAMSGDITFPSGAVFFQQIGVALSDSELLVNPQESTFGGGGGSASTRYYRQSLIGVKNGINTVFTTAIRFGRNAFGFECLYLNGMRLEDGLLSDYVVSESGGVGTGYDTVTFAFPPIATDELSIDFEPFV